MERSVKIGTVAKITSIAGTAGSVIGLAYAFKKQKKFWGYVGFMVLGSLILSGTAYVASSALIKEE
ncbi:MAG: hypothetical protein WCT77_00245 [Bacteroidota bacterium]|jgi:hypothetical protein